MEKISAISDFHRYADHKEYVSFDLFDTLIKRKFLKTNEVHDTVSAYALTLIGRRRERSPFDLTLLRYRMSDALKASGPTVIQEPLIDLVWDRILARDVNDAGQRTDLVNQIVAFEHAIEMANLRLVDGARDLLLRLKTENKKIIAISDMYFSFNQMKLILEKLEIFDLFDHVYVSADANLTKQTGDLFRRVLSDIDILPHQLLHVGDNHRSDILMATGAGVQAVMVEQPQLLQIERPEYGRRAQIEEDVADLVKLHLFSLLLDARNRSAEHVFFMGRDGCVISRFLHAWKNPVLETFLAPPQFSDMFLNRVLTCWGGIDFSGEWLVQAIGFAFWLHHAEATAAELSALLGIDEVPRALGTASLKSSEDTERTVQAYRDAGLEPKIRDSIVAKRAKLEHYLQDIGFFDLKSVIFSDIGYSGTVLRDINSLFLHRAAEENPLTPPAMALHLIATNDNYAPNQMRAYPYVDFAQSVIFPASLLPIELKQSFAWLEFFFKHPTLRPILQFVQLNGKLTPELIEDEPPAKLTPGQRVEGFAIARDEDIVLLWMAAADRFEEIAEPMINRFAKPDLAIVDQMRDEVFELHSIAGARRSIILEVPHALPEAIAAAARADDYWIPGSIVASSIRRGSTYSSPGIETPKRELPGIAGRIRRSFSKVSAQALAPARGFDASFYRSFYSDLRQFETDADLWKHYTRHGRREGRITSRAALETQLRAEIGTIPVDFDADSYLYYNPELNHVLDTPEQALNHYMRWGKKEGRIYRPNLSALITEFEHLHATGSIVFTAKEERRFQQGENALTVYLGRHNLVVGPWIDRIDVVEFRALHSAWCGAVASKAQCIVALCEYGLLGQPSLSLRSYFDPAYYRDQEPELARSSDDEVYRHYLNVGCAKGFAPSEQAALLQLWGHADFPDCFDWHAYQARMGHQLGKSGRARILKAFIDAPGIDRLEFVHGEGSATFIEFLAERAWRLHGRNVEAAKLYEAALTAGAKPGRVRHFLGDLATLAGKPMDALAHYRSALADARPDRWSYINASSLALAIGDYRTALADLSAGRRAWQEMAPWRRAYRQAMNAWCQSFCQRLRASPDAIHLLTEADEIVGQVDARFPAPAHYAAVSEGVLVLTARAVTSLRRDDDLTQGVTVCGLQAIEDQDFLASLLQCDEVILHEVPFTYESLHAISAARSLGKRITLWLGDFVAWRGHALDRCLWGKHGDELSPLRMSNLDERGLIARLCDQVVTTMAGCGPCLHSLAPDTPIEEITIPLTDVRGPERGKRFVLALASPDTATVDLTRLADGIVEAARNEPYLQFIIDEQVAARRDLRDIAGRWSTIATDPQLPTLSRIIGNVDAVVQALSPSPRQYAMWAQASAHAIPALAIAALTVPERARTIVAATTFPVRQAETDWPDDMPALVGDLPTAISRLASKADRVTPVRATTTLPSPPMAAAKPRRKRILFANVFFAPQVIGGATRVLKDNIDYLIDHHADEFEIAVVTSDEQNEHCGEFLLDNYRGIPVFRIATPQEVNMDWRPSNSMVGAYFSAILDSFQPDLVHIHCLQRLSVAIAEICYTRKLPYFVTLHDAWWISDFPFLSNEDGLPASARRDFLNQPHLASVGLMASAQRAQRLRTALLGANKRLAVSESFADVYRRCGIPCETVENGTSLIPPQPRQKGTERVNLCHIGGLQHHKGAYLIEAALRSHHYENLHFTVVNLALGQGDETHSIWGNTPVTITGKMSTDELSSFYARMHVLLAPSTWPESYGLVTREAIAHGLWVIASDQGAMADPVAPGRNGFVVSIDDASGVAEALAAIDREPNRYLISPPPTDAVRTADDQSRELIALYRSIER